MNELLVWGVIIGAIIALRVFFWLYNQYLRTKRKRKIWKIIKGLE